MVSTTFCQEGVAWWGGSLLPGSKGQDKRTQVAPGEVQVIYQEKYLHWKGEHVWQP